MQHTHYTSEFKPRKFPIVIVSDNISNAANIGSLFRIADAFGIDKIIFCGNDFLLGRRFKKTSRSAEKFVNFSIEANIESVLEELSKKDYRLIALEITDKSQPLAKIDINNKPIAIIVGNEITGVSDTVLALVNDTYHITMFGHNSSMNVSHATSIALYEITNQINGNNN